MFELFPGDGGAGGIIGKAQVDQVRGDLRATFGDESVFGVAVQVDNAIVASIPIRSRAAGHDIGVQVDRVDRVGNGNAGIGVENLLDIPRIALGAVADEYFVGTDVGPAGLKIIFGNRFAQEFIALLRTVSAETGIGGHLVNSLVKGGDTGMGRAWVTSPMPSLITA
jgi:hypothetical protein